MCRPWFTRIRRAAFVEISDDSLRPAPVNPLSEQEHRVLRRFADGKSPVTSRVSSRLGAQTLRNHLHHINQKLGTHNRLDVVTHAIRRN